ncbi:MAG: hypothetical protein ACI3YK_00060 [Eubacteriales bacterium]
MEENKKSNACGVICKILMIIGLAAVVAAVMTLICKKFCAKSKENQILCESDDSAIDDYDECCYDNDDLEDNVDGDTDDDSEPEAVEEEKTDDESDDKVVTD